MLSMSLLYFFTALADFIIFFCEIVSIFVRSFRRISFKFRFLTQIISLSSWDLPLQACLAPQFGEAQTHVNLVDLVNSFPESIRFGHKNWFR